MSIHLICFYGFSQGMADRGSGREASGSSGQALAERNPEIVASLKFKNSSERPKEAQSSSCQEAVSKSS